MQSILHWTKNKWFKIILLSIFLAVIAIQSVALYNQRLKHQVIMEEKEQYFTSLVSEKEQNISQLRSRLDLASNLVSGLTKALETRVSQPHANTLPPTNSELIQIKELLEEQRKAQKSQCMEKETRDWNLYQDPINLDC